MEIVLYDNDEEEEYEEEEDEEEEDEEDFIYKRSLHERQRARHLSSEIKELELAALYSMRYFTKLFLYSPTTLIFVFV